MRRTGICWTATPSCKFSGRSMNICQTQSKMRKQILGFPGLLGILCFQQGFQVGIPLWFGYASSFFHGVPTLEGSDVRTRMCR
jgi:hypothetical protein